MTRHDNTDILTSKPSLLYSDLKKNPAAYIGNTSEKLNLLQLKIVSELRKNLSSFFYHIKFIVYETVWSKTIYSAIAPHLFFTDIYRMVNFDKICL